jgi:hypothetical protein
MSADTLGMAGGAMSADTLGMAGGAMSADTLGMAGGAMSADTLGATLVQARERLGLLHSGLVHLEHINLVVGDRRHSETFYFGGLGLTRDPNKSHGTTVWANCG